MIAAIRPGCLNCGNPRTCGGARGLCQVCYEQPDVRRRYPCRRRGPKRVGDCLHCGRSSLKGGGRGLCAPCYLDLDIREMYPTLRDYGGPWEGEPDPRPDQQPGDPSHRCVWCMAFRCDGPLEKCGECEAEYKTLAAGMPGK